MVKFFILIFVLLFHSLYASNFEEFYILPMGQGNAQLVIYAQGSEKIGVLYDLGSKSLQTHPKFMNRRKWDKKYKPILQTIGEHVDSFPITPSKNKKDSSSEILKTPAFSIEITDQSQQLLTVDGKLNSLQRDQHKENLESFIYNLLSDLSHLIVFVSHSDQDHINYLNQKTIPNFVPLTIFFCGDWFGNVGCLKKNETNVTEDVKNVLKFLAFRLQQNARFIQFNFTYYQNFQTDRGIPFNDFIREKLQSDESLKSLVNNFERLCSRDNYDLTSPVAPPFFTGYLRDLYPFFFPDQESGRENASSTSISFLMDHVKNNIYIWSMNHLTDDINGQSAVVSCTLPSLNMSVILTGDAQHSTFQRIFSEYRGRNFRSILKGITPDHLVLFMLPHHGSHNNSSTAGLNFFQPDILGIAAGDGGQHGHPSYELIEELYQKYLSRHRNFLSHYEPEKIMIDFIAIQGKTLKLIKSNRRTVPFLSPNLYGCIKWDKDGISTNFDNTLEYGDKEYKILYSSHVWECDLMAFNRLKSEKMTEVFSVDEINTSVMELLPNDQSDEIIVQKQESDELFVGVRVEDKIYFYRILES